VALDQLIKAFRVFIARDLVFIISGAVLVSAFLHIFKRVPEPSDSWVLFALLAGISYFVAYAIQDTLCVFRVLPSAPVSNPCAFVRLMYKGFYQRQWKPIVGKIECDEARHKVPLERQPELERLITLQQIGTAGGPCMFFSGVGFLVAWRQSCSTFELATGIAGCVVGLMLACLAWLKAAQRAKFLATLERN
jgi:hypothetical protein